jgi:hypothetical protein
VRPEPGQVLHFSEDPSITRFEPHIAPTSTLRDPLVWAVDAARSPGYWFPRNCPWAMAWARLGPPEPVGSLLRLHDEAGIQLRVLPHLWPFWDAVIASSLGYSGIRLRNTRPRPAR